MIASCERCTTPFFTRCFGLIADCIPLISSGVATYLRAVFTIDFTGDIAISVATLAPCTALGATFSAHRASALLPFVASVQAHFTICGANRSDGSSVTSFCAHSISLVPAIAVPITPPPHL